MLQAQYGAHTQNARMSDSGMMPYVSKLWRTLLPAISHILFPPRLTEVLVQGASAEDLESVAVPRPLVHIPLQPMGLLPYRHPLVHACIVEGKFHGNERAAWLLGIYLGIYLYRYIQGGKNGEKTHEMAKKWVLVPVPLSKRRQRERGYNQAERYARIALSGPAGDTISLDCSVLVRKRHTAPQTTLSGASRRKNLLEAFSAGHFPDPTAHYLILDDVCTTGATLAAASEALRGAGAHIVSAIALSY
jgi:ComF family protein